MIAATLGAGPVADAFYAAFRLPNLFRRLLAEGAFNTAFIPLFAKEVESGGDRQAAEFAGEVFSALCVILLALTLVAMAFMPFLITIIVPGFSDDPGKFAVTTDLARIMFPYLAAMSVMAMLSGIVNTYRSYFLPALAPVLLNVVLVGVLASALVLDLPQQTTGYAIASGVVVAGVLQLAVLIYAMRKIGFSFRPKAVALSPKVRRLLALAAPAALTGGIVQINILIGQIIASQQDSAISWLSYADRLYQLPLGVVGIAIGVVLLPELSRALSAGDLGETHKLQNRSLEFGMALTIPAAAALIVIPNHIVSVLYERGAFTADTTDQVAVAVAAFGIGLPSFVLIKILQPAYFAREDMKTPMWISLVSLVVNVAASLALFPVYGHVGVAIATSVAGWVNAIVLALLLTRERTFQVDGSTWRRLAMIVVSTAVMSAALYGYLYFSDGMFAASGIAVRLPLLAVGIAVASMIYFASVFITGGVDRTMLRQALKRKSKGA